ncbi:MAG: tol-pal system protein YbgF [Gemmatimonadaceae bacterium]|nr:tol-pal system protein YbgF [Gemmatimonadaceae bacterium]
MIARRLPVAVLGALVLSACVATKQDVLLLQADLKAARSEYAFRDSLRRTQFDSVIRTMVILNDSIRGLKGELAAFQGNVLGDLFKVRDGLIEIRALTGQSQSRITELRAELEQRNSIMQSQPPAPVTPPTGGVTPPVRPPETAAPAPTGSAGASTGAGATLPASAPATAPATAAPGPNQLYTMALDQLRRGSTGAARAGFSDFLVQYPQHERAGDAQYYIAETLERDTKPIDAEAAYLSVYTRFPRSEKAPTAMFKRAALLRTQNKPDKAREVLDLLVRTYPRSDEADLARERLRAPAP